MRTHSSVYLLLILRYFNILTQLWPSAFSVMFQPYGVGLGYSEQFAERIWAVVGGAELRRGGLRMVKVQTTLREAQRNERESQGEGTQVGEEGLW